MVVHWTPPSGKLLASNEWWKSCPVSRALRVSSSEGLSLGRQEEASGEGERPLIRGRGHGDCTYPVPTAFEFGSDLNLVPGRTELAGAIPLR